MSGVCIRPIESGEDLAQSARVVRKAFCTVADELAITRDNCPTHPSFITTAKLEEMQVAGGKLFGLFAEDVQAGFAAVIDQGNGVFSMEKLAVLPTFRRRGFGNALTEFAIDYARANGGAVLSIAIVDENRVLKDWYLQQGFAIVETKTFDTLPFGVCYMEKKIESAGFSEPVEMEFTARVDGSTQRYVELRPTGFDPAKPVNVMIALHGHGGDRWQYVNDDIDECRGARDTAEKHGFLYVSPDYRTDSWMGPVAEADVVQVIEDLRARYNVAKLIVVGASMGGSSALTFTILHPEMVDGACAQKAMANYLEFENYQDTVSAGFGGSKQEIPEEYKKRSAEFWPEKFTMPIALTCGALDQAVPPQSVLRLSEKLKQVGADVLMIHDPNSGHRTSYEDTVRAVEWVIDKVIGG